MADGNAAGRAGVWHDRGRPGDNDVMAGTARGPEHRRLPVRASDAEREEAVAGLRERFAAGQLSQDTFVARMESALGARDVGELAELFADLPPSRPHRPAPWAGLVPRLAAAVSPVRDAAATAARWVSEQCREPRLPGLSFPAGSQYRFTIGRDPGCDLVIADLTVSRQHAGLDRSLRGWLLTDFGSTNGTRLNGWRVREPVPVRPGDRVSFGAVTFVLRERSAPAAG
jgi:FHA domain/Domain of unknown function (DUF1707)